MRSDWLLVIGGCAVRIDRIRICIDLRPFHPGEFRGCGLAFPIRVFFVPFAPLADVANLSDIARGGGGATSERGDGATCPP